MMELSEEELSEEELSEDELSEEELSEEELSEEELSEEELSEEELSEEELSEEELSEEELSEEELSEEELSEEELSEEELSELPMFGVNYQPNSFKRKEFESKRVLYYNGFNKENKESEKYCEFTIFDDDTYKQPQRGNKNAKVKSVKPKKTSPKIRTKEAVMGKEIPMADYLHTVRNFTLIIIMNACSFLLMYGELIERRAALRQVFREKVPHRMKIAIINKSDKSSCKLEELRTEFMDNNIEIIDHLQRSDYEFLFENYIELTGDFWRKGRKGDMLELLKLVGEINQVHEEENPDGEEIPGEEIVALMGISVRGLEPVTEEEGANDFDVHDIKGPPRREEDVSLPKNIGIIFSDEPGLMEEDDEENVVDLKEQSVSNRENVEDRDETTESVSEDILQEVNLLKGLEIQRGSRRQKQPHGQVLEADAPRRTRAAPIHQAHLSKNLILILHALVNYVRLHAMNAFIVPGSHLVRHPIFTSEVYVIIRIFENGEEIICRLFKNKKGKHAEDVCLEALEDLMKGKKNTDNWYIMMYVSYSPCNLCRLKIIEFIGKNEISLGLRFHTLFQINRAFCETNICKCKQFPKHDQNKQEFIDMKDNPYIDSIGIVAADERQDLSEVLQLNFPEDILQKLNTQKEKDDFELAKDAKDLRILKEEMNVVRRPKGWRPQIYTPETGNPTVRTREARPGGDDLQSEEDKLDEATGGADVGG